MDTSEQNVHMGVCKFLQRALRKLKTIDLNPLNDDLMDPSGSYTIKDLLKDNISYLEHFLEHIIDETDSDQNGMMRRSIAYSQDENGENSFSHSRFTKQRMEIKNLEANLMDLENAFENLHQERHERKQLEIACNRFVSKWEQMRREQLEQVLADRMKSFCTEIARQDSKVNSGLRAAHLINDFYDLQLSKMENEISEWMDRFDREKEQVDSRCQKARAQIRRWDEMKEQFGEMAMEIVKMEQLEMEYVRDAEHKKMCQKYAVKLQAWWRGVMVRKGLGPYGKSKKKKSKGKKKAAKGAKTANRKPIKRVK